MRQTRYTPKTASVPVEEPKSEWTGSQRFSDIHRCIVQDGFIIIKAHRTKNQSGDRHGKNIRDKIMTPVDAARWADTAQRMAAQMAITDLKASAELSEICDDLKAKCKEALKWREAHNVGPEEIGELLKWKKNVY